MSRALRGQRKAEQGLFLCNVVARKKTTWICGSESWTDMSASCFDCPGGDGYGKCLTYPPAHKGHINTPRTLSAICGLSLLYAHELAKQVTKPAIQARRT